MPQTVGNQSAINSLWTETLLFMEYGSRPLCLHKNPDSSKLVVFNNLLKSTYFCDGSYK